MISVFKATARKGDNSLIFTIPKEVAEGLEIKHGTDLRVTVQLVGDKEE